MQGQIKPFRKQRRDVDKYKDLNPSADRVYF